MIEQYLQIPNTEIKLREGYKIRLGRFGSSEWTVKFGWYEYAGNRPVCGWYIVKDDGMTIKPILLPDMYDIVVLTRN